MGKGDCKNTHPDEAEVLNPPRDEENLHKYAPMPSDVLSTPGSVNTTVQDEQSGLTSQYEDPDQPQDPQDTAVTLYAEMPTDAAPTGSNRTQRCLAVVAREQDGWMRSVRSNTSLTAMEKEVCENTHPEQEEVLKPPRDEENQYQSDSSPHGMGRKCHREQKLLAPLCVVLSVLVLVLVVALVVVQLQSRSSHPQFSHMCPATWIGFQSKCYHFSENETNWNTSLEKCKALEASLTSIDSLEELAFVKRYMVQGNHWFGLHEEDDGRWRWTNGTAFNNWFQVWGGGPCAYLNQEMISSARCDTEKYWICSRPNSYVKWRQKINPE